MSWITDVVVHVDFASKEVEKELLEIFPAGTYSSGAPRRETLGRADTDDAGGGKVFCGDVYFGAYNHLDQDAFLSWFEALPWNRYSHAVISMASEGEFYKVYRIKDGELEKIAEWSGE